MLHSRRLKADSLTDYEGCVTGREPDEHLEINPLNLEITSLQTDPRFPPASTLSNSKTHQHQGSRAVRETANLVQQGG